ncbi:MAG: transglycosylase [Xanthobacteraceae bacterium]
MSRRKLLSGTTGTILLFAGFICAAAIVPTTQPPELPDSNIIQSNPFRRGDRESRAAIDGALAALRQALAPFRSGAAIPPPAVPKDLSYLADYAYSETPPDKKPADVVLQSLQDIPVGTPVDEIKLASDAFGLDFPFMKAVARIESDFDPTQRTGSYIGLFQLSHYEFDRYGSGDIISPRDNAIAAAYKFATEAALFEIDTHIKATLLDLYLIHQQGWQGAAEHISHPQRIAWQSMCATDEGHQKGEKWCKRAIWQNTLPDIKHAYKSVDNLTSAAFTEMWRQRLAMFYARYSETVSAK